MSDYDLVITDVRIVDPERAEPAPGDIAIRDGRIVATGAGLAAEAAGVFDGGGLLAFPGVVDAHQHWGIYNPLAEDAAPRAAPAAQGGVTTGLNYMRTGQYYLNHGGPYAEFFPEVLRRIRGPLLRRLRLPPRADDERATSTRSRSLIDDFGVTSFKIFMFYGGYGLHGASSRPDDVPDDRRPTSATTSRTSSS